MRKNKLLLASAAIAATMLTACTDQTEFSQADLQNAAQEAADGQIQFGTYLGDAITRGTTGATYTGGTINNDNYEEDDTKQAQGLKNAKFGVFAYYTGSDVFKHDTKNADFMYNEKIEWKQVNSTYMWTYDTPKFWPNGIDAANAANDPSKTATEQQAGMLSFFAYAPYVANTTDDYPDTPEYGALPVDGSAKTNYFKTNNYKSDRSSTSGVVGMVDNEYTKDPWVNYVMKKTDGALTTAKSGGIDLLWGLRGQYTYDETDNADNTIAKLGEAYNTDLTKQSVGERVRFLFKHAMAKIGGSKKKTGGEETDPAQSGLKVVVDIDANSAKPGQGEDNLNKYFSSSFSNDKTLVTIKSVSLMDPFTYTVTNDPTKAITNEVSNLNTWGWFNLATGEWKNAGHAAGNTADGSEEAGGATFALTIDNSGTSGVPQLNDLIKEVASYSKSSGSGAKKIDGTDNTKWATGNPVGVKTSATPLYKNEDNGGIMLIPGTAAQTIYVTVDYFVRTADPQLAKGYTEVEQIITNKVELAGLEANKFYTLVIHLGLTSVKFEAVVADWANSTGATYDENGNVTDTDVIEQTSVWLPSNVVNSTSIYADAGTSHKTVTVDPTVTSYTVHLTGLNGTSGNKLSWVANGNIQAGSSTISTEGSEQTITVTLTANATKNPVTSTLSVIEKSSDETTTYETTTITIIQQGDKLILTPSTKSIAYNGSFDIKATHANGTDFNVEGATITVSDGSTAAVDGSDKSIIHVNPNMNLTKDNKTITVNVKTATNEVTEEVPVTVIQAAFTGDLYVSFTPTGNIPAAGTDTNKKTLVVKNNGEDVATTNYTVTIDYVNGTGWLSYANGGLTATANSESSIRSAVVTVKYIDSGKTHTGTITVTQEGSSPSRKQ